MNMIDSLLPLLVLLVIVSLVVNFFLSRSLRRLRSEDVRRLFPVTVGKARVGKVEPVVNIDLEDNYRIVLVYDYMVDGQLYTGVYRSYTTRIDADSLAPEQIESPDVGKELDIAYDPTNPADSHVRE